MARPGSAPDRGRPGLLLLSGLRAAVQPRVAAAVAHRRERRAQVAIPDVSTGHADGPVAEEGRLRVEPVAAVWQLVR